MVAFKFQSYLDTLLKMHISGTPPEIPIQRKENGALKFNKLADDSNVSARGPGSRETEN